MAMMYIKLHIIIVKLNNPLMGTETVFLLLYRYVMSLFYVKLNNPLMGTETILIRMFMFITPSYIMLN